MIRQCATCLLLMGEKPPYENTEITHTACEKCFKKQMKIIEQINKRNKKAA